MPHWSGSVTSYRICCECGAETVVRDDQLDDTEWRITSLHFHEGECPECSRGRITAAEPEPAVADGGHPTLEAFSKGDEV